MHIPPAEASPVNPVFVILDPPRDGTWVYVDHRIWRDLARTYDDHLVFQLAAAPRTPTLVEVLFPPPAAPPSP
jgi:hypothetical protein